MPDSASTRHSGILLTGALLFALSGCGDAAGGAESAQAVNPGSVALAMSYGQDGVDSILPISAKRPFTLGFVARNRSENTVIITSVEPVQTVDARAPRVAVVGTPRFIGEVASDIAFPPPDADHWPPGSVRPLAGGISLPPGETSAQWGALFLLGVEVVGTFALVDGYRVQGTVDARPFEDVVDARTVICTDSETVSPECRAFAAKHGFDAAAF